MQLTTDDLSQIWLRFSVMGRSTQESIFFGAYPTEMNTNIPTSLRGGAPSVWGYGAFLFKYRYLEAHRVFKLLPEWCYLILFSFFSHGQVVSAAGHPYFLCLPITALKALIRLL